MTVDAGDQAHTLHVVEVAEGLAEPLLASIAELGATFGVRPRVAIVGPASAAERATRYGCDVVAQRCPPLRDPMLAVRALRSMAMSAGRRSSRDLVVWGSSTLASLLVGCSLGFTWVVQGDVARLPDRLAQRLRGVQALTMNLTDADVARLGRWFDGLVVRPVGVGLGSTSERLPLRSRTALRQRWGVEEGEVVVGLFGPSPQRTDFRRAADVVGIAAVRGARIKLVGHPASARARRSLRWMAEVGLGQMPLILDPAMAEPWEVAGGIDLALVLGDGVHTAGADVSGRSSRSLITAVSRWLGTGESMTVVPHLAPLWLARAGVPMISERKGDAEGTGGGAADADEELAFDIDNPLAATRILLALATDREFLRRKRTDARERASHQVIDPIWERVFGVSRVPLAHLT